MRKAVEIVPTRSRHITTIANRMRVLDRIECDALGRTPKESLRAGYWQSKMCWTALVDGRPEALFGLVVVNAIEGRGSPWMLGTEIIYKHGRELVMHGPALLAHMTDSTPILENIVSAGNHRAIRLLQRWGFTVDERLETVGGLAFRQFRMNANVRTRDTNPYCDSGNHGKRGLLCMAGFGTSELSI